MTPPLYIAALNPESPRMREDAARLHAAFLANDAAARFGPSWLERFYYRRLSALPGVTCRLAYLRGVAVGLIVVERNGGRSRRQTLRAYWRDAAVATLRSLCDSPRRIADLGWNLRALLTPLPRANNIVHLAFAPGCRHLVEGPLLTAALEDLGARDRTGPRPLRRAA